MKVTSRSPMMTRPAVGVSSPAIILSVVVLPQPEGPSRQTNSPSPISRLRSETAVKSPNFLVTPSNLTEAMKPQALMPPKNRKPNFQLTKR
jgi:hypothetical protein